jgi:hypothetical protein
MAQLGTLIKTAGTLWMAAPSPKILRHINDISQTGKLWTLGTLILPYPLTLAPAVPPKIGSTNWPEILPGAA